MATCINYDDVLSQLRSFGLVIESLEVDTVKPKRVFVEGERERKGWYWLHEIRLDTGEYAIVGAFGVWHGTDSNTQKVQLKTKSGQIELNDEQKKALKARMAADRRRADVMREKQAAKAAARATKMWGKLVESADCKYLVDKGIGMHGTRATPDGTLAVPMMDINGGVHGLQFIGPKVRKKLVDTDKQFWPYGMNPIGRHLILGSPGWLILICEGYATAATLHENTGHAVVAAFTAGNLLPVAEIIRKRHRTARILICADDDFATRGNPGVSSASAAAMSVNGKWVAPFFKDEALRADLEAAALDQSASDYKQRVETIRAGRKKLTDFNDLQAYATPRAVGSQIEDKLAELGWVEQVSVRDVIQTGGGGTTLRAITSAQEIFERFAIVYGHNKTLFDFQERMLISIEDMKNACAHRELWRTWMESPDKKIVRVNNVGFDPSNEDPEITCNLWGGWPTTPIKGECGNLKGLLEYMCTHEHNHADLNLWVLRWLAYPIRNPGAKMKTALIFHGWQGVGKNLFFEIIMAIYGEYGRIIDQNAIEDKFNDWLSKKLFLIADEVVARQELYHVKGKLKSMITGDWIRIRPMYVTAYNERNHANLVFLSNEILPIILDRDDRRFAVVWTPKQLSADLYKTIRTEIDAGGIAALHYFLKHDLDMGEFTPWTRPPMTQAKQDLIEVSMDSTERFCIEWIKERIEFIPSVPTKSTRLYAFYREWCSRSGYARYAPEPKFLAEVSKRQGMKKKTARYITATGSTIQAAFIYPPGADVPPDKSEQVWLGECLSQFDFGVMNWRDEGDTRPNVSQM